MSPRRRPTRAALAAVAAVAALTAATHSAAAPPPTIPAAVAAELPGPVAGWGTTAGTDGRVYLADESGRALQLRGGNHKTTDPDTLTDDLLAAAAERGLDHIRLAIFWDRLEPADDQFDEAYLDRVVAALDRAEEHGILVILDMHQDVYGEYFGSDGVPAWATRTDGHPYTPNPVWLLNYLQPAVQAAFEHLYEDPDLRDDQIQVWLHVVDRVADHPALLGYDLMNEPFGQIRPGEDLVSAAARVEREQLTPMYQRLTDAISAVDDDHWVFIEPPNLASLGFPTSLGEVRGPKVALYPHMYDPAIESATYTPGGEIEYDPAFFDRWADAITVYPDTHPVPMLVGEWGVAHPDAVGMDLFVRDSLRTLDEVGSGWSVFNWCFGSGYCPLDATGADRPGISQIFHPYARAIAGAPQSTVWDPDARSLTVGYVDGAATGPTEIFLPVSRTYPDGWVVETSEPAGAWSSTFDEATGVLAVTVPDDGTGHAICVKPAGAPAGCVAVEPAAAPTTTTTVAAGATTTTVVASTATPRFTG